MLVPVSSTDDFRGTFKKCPSPLRGFFVNLLGLCNDELALFLLEKIKSVRGLVPITVAVIKK